MLKLNKASKDNGSLKLELSVELTIENEKNLDVAHAVSEILVNTLKDDKVDIEDLQRNAIPLVGLLLLLFKK